MSYRKFSIEDRKEYYGKKPIKNDKESEFAIGYYQVIKSGRLPKDLSKYSKATANGMTSAFNAIFKSRNLKF